MDLLSNLDDTAWVNCNAEEKTGFDEYRIAKKAKEDEGHYSYAVFNNYGNLQTVHLRNADPCYDPLHNINNCELRLNEEGTAILGICIEDDCVLSKGLLAEPTDKVDGENIIKENGTDGHGDVMEAQDQNIIVVNEHIVEENDKPNVMYELKMVNTDHTDSGLALTEDIGRAT